MTANDSKSYLAYLNKLVDQYNNNYHHSINKKPVGADYYALTEKVETNHKALKFNPKTAEEEGGEFDHPLWFFKKCIFQRESE